MSSCTETASVSAVKRTVRTVFSQVISMSIYIFHPFLTSVLLFFCYLFKKISPVNNKVTYRNILSSHDLTSTLYMLKSFPNKTLTMLHSRRAFPMLWQHLQVLRILLQWNNNSEWQLGLQCMRNLLKKQKNKQKPF